MREEFAMFAVFVDDSEVDISRVKNCLLTLLTIFGFLRFLRHCADQINKFS